MPQNKQAPTKLKKPKKDPRKHPASGYDEKNPTPQFPPHSRISRKKLPDNK